VGAYRIHHHDAAEALAPGVWRIRGNLTLPVTRNMIVIRLASGGLLLHSLIALDEAGMKALEALGRPAYAIVPSQHHQMDAPFYRARYPDLMILCPEAARIYVEPRSRIDGTVEDILPALGVRLHTVPGIKIVEYAYDVPMPEGGRMLLLNDVLANVGATRGFLGWLIFRKLIEPSEGPRVGDYFRRKHVRDLDTVNRFLAGLGTIRNLRLVTVSHGDPVAHDPASALKALVLQDVAPLSATLNPNVK
jgi:hypothetical protein